MKKLLLAFPVILALAMSPAGEDKLPDVTVKKLHGGTVNIADYGKNDKITVLSFWATWCSPCKKKLNNIADLCTDWEDAYDAEVIAISIDDAKNAPKVNAYALGQNWPYTILLDENQDLKRALNFQTIPYTIVVDKSGNIVYRHNGYIEGDEYILEEKLKALSAK